MSAWRPYDSQLLPAFFERFEQRWGKGTAAFLDPEVREQPLPRAQWINPDTGAALAVVPIWTEDPRHRSFGLLPPADRGHLGAAARADRLHRKQQGKHSRINLPPQ
jgi:hypothetical protein